MFCNFSGQSDFDWEDFPEGYLNGLTEFFNGEPRKRGLDIYEDVFSSLLFPLQRKKELIKMIQLVRGLKPTIVGEIGCDKAGSLYHWCSSFPTVKKVIAIEFRGIPYRVFFEKTFPNIEFCWIHGSSYDPRSIQAVRNFIDGETIDSMFLDGDKSAFLQDFKAYSPMIRKGGVVLMHDINGEPPEHALNEVSRTYITSTIIDVSEVDEADFLNITRPITAWEDWLRFWGKRSCGVGVVHL